MRKLSHISTLLICLTLITGIGGSHVVSLILDDSSYVWVENSDNCEHESEHGEKDVDTKDIKICPGNIDPVAMTFTEEHVSTDVQLTSHEHWEITTPPPEQV